MIWDDIQSFEIPDKKAYEENHEARMKELHEALYNHEKKMMNIKKEFERRRYDFNLEQPAANLEDLSPNPDLAEMDKELSKLLNW